MVLPVIIYLVAINAVGFRHKTRKEPFRTYLYITVLINLIGFVALSSPEMRERILSELLR